MTTQSSPSTPTTAVLKRLFAVSGNRCAFPKCEHRLVQQDTLIGEVCHIKAASDNGPRGDVSLPPEQRHSYENLILLCANHHTVVDDDPEAYTVDRLLKMKKDHEARWATEPNGDSERGAQLLLAQLVSSNGQSGGITAHTVHQVINVHAPAENAPDDVSRKQREARRALAPELQRTIERALYIHGRAMANFICHSAENDIKPNDRKQDFIPYWPSLYPNAPQVRDLHDDDVAALAAFYDSLTALNDQVNDWWEREGQMPVNLFNVFRDSASKSLKLGLTCIEKFGVELFRPEYESWGSLSDRINRSLASEKSAMEHHLKRFEAKRVQDEGQRALAAAQRMKGPLTTSWPPGGPRRK
ncbi:MAG: endonuclease [Nevskia sp.]|nr:endonuclease [Nevskia sp.]